MLNRREFLLSSLATPLVLPSSIIQAQTAASGKMLLAMHQNTSRAAGFRGSLEGWSRAGIEYVELNDTALDGFLENDTKAAIHSVKKTKFSGEKMIQNTFEMVKNIIF